ncbi:hypothetical protein DFJ73DRAFT_794575 [Zopfochytrium polystomum]|nr:hypothetical protein DFJ73DRAFT_794575 [Zopfochytrium polystomum]
MQQLILQPWTYWLLPTVLINVHYRLLTRTALPNGLIALPLAAVVLFMGLYVRSTLSGFPQMLAVAAVLMMLMRFLEAGAAFGRLDTVRWSPTEYIDFFFTGDTSENRRLLRRLNDLKAGADAPVGGTAGSTTTSTSSPSTEVTPTALPSGQAEVPAAKRDLAFRLMNAVHVSLSYFGLLFATAYVQKYRPFSTPGGPSFVLDLTNLPLVLDVVVLGVYLVTLMDLHHRLIFLTLSELLQCDFVPLMDLPFFSSSLRAFWSRNWNSIVKKALQRVIYLPVVNVLAAIDRPSQPAAAAAASDDKRASQSPPTTSLTRGGGGRKADKRKPATARAAALPPPPASATPSAATSLSPSRRRLHVTLGVLATFFASGVLHELMLVVMDRPQPTRLEALGFFVLQGVWCVCEGAVARAWASSWTAASGARPPPRGVVVACVELVAGWASMAFALLLFSPLFVRPFVEAGLLEKYVVPSPPGLLEKLKDMLP